MRTEKRFSPLGDFDFSALDGSEYNEAAVREDIITPIVKALGYAVTGRNKMVRGRKLLHPFVSIGSQSKKIYIFPDYVMEINDRPSWIIEAKDPREDLFEKSHLEQAYSYANTQ